MPRAIYLADTSVFSRLSKPAVALVMGPRIAEGRVAICAPVAFELAFSARNAADHDALMSRLAAFESVPVTDADHRRAVEVQSLLARRGQHRMLSLVDALVCAVAESRGFTVLHYDNDFDAVAKLTKQAHEWVVPRGTPD